MTHYGCYSSEGPIICALKGLNVCVKKIVIPQNRLLKMMTWKDMVMSLIYLYVEDNHFLSQNFALVLIPLKIKWAIIRDDKKSNIWTLTSH